MARSTRTKGVVVCGGCLEGSEHWGQGESACAFWKEGLELPDSKGKLGG